MAYLCEGCHSKVTRGIWSKEKIEQCRQRPWCVRHGRPHDAFDISGPEPTIWLGPNRIINVPVLLQVRGEPVLQIGQPETVGGPYLISGRFYDSDGNLLFSIDRNEWIGEPSSWDIECVGPRITVRRDHRAIALQLRAVPPHGILVERANVLYEGAELIVDSRELRVTSPTKSAVAIQGRTIRGTGEHAVLVSVNADGTMEIGPGPFVIEAVPFEPLKVQALRDVLAGRNEPCPSGSLKKYKKCHGKA
jgi:hypothetical protein